MQDRESDVIQIEECVAKEQYKRTKTIEREPNWKDKNIYGQY